MAGRLTDDDAPPWGADGGASPAAPGSTEDATGRGTDAPTGNGNGHGPPQAGRTAVVVTRRRRRPLWLLVVLPLLGAALLGGASVTVNRESAPAYTADTLLAALPTDPTAQVSLPIAGVWVQVGNSPALVDEVAPTLHVSREELASSLTVTQPSTDAPVIAVAVTTSDPLRSARWANAVAARMLLDASPSPVPGFMLRQVSAATPPVTTSAKLSGTIIAAATAIGAVAGLVLAQSLVRMVDRRRRRTAAAR